jgi:hypothetical protein
MEPIDGVRPQVEDETLSLFESTLEEELLQLLQHEIQRNPGLSAEELLDNLLKRWRVPLGPGGGHRSVPPTEVDTDMPQDFDPVTPENRRPPI